MTVPADPRAARIRRLGMLFVLAAGLTVFAVGPSALGLGGPATFAWWVIPQMAGPLVASIFCFWAARRSQGMEVAAWTYFGIGSGLYFFGNLLYLGFALLGIDLGFPALPELAYFIMAIFFAVGMARYGKAPPQNTGVQFLTFLLVYGAVTAGCLLLLHEAIRDSAMGEFATITAFLYPALWFSVASYGLMMLALRDQRDNTVPFAILLVAMFAEAIADFRYALDLMSGVYTLGGATAVLWLASTFCLCWSAVEQGLKPVSVAASSAPPEGEISRIGAQALIPATATGLIMLSASASGAFGASPYSLFAAGLAIVLAAIVGTREYRLISTQRRLTASSKASQAQLAGSERRLASVLQSTSDSVIVLDHEWQVRFYNDRAKEQLPGLSAIGIGGRFWDLLSPQAMEAYGDFFERSMASRMPRQIEAYSSTQDMWFELRTYPTPEGMSLFFRDISEARRIRNEIAYLAHHDFLTGLANRVLFHERLDDAVRQGPTAVFLLDLDHFKEVNDMLGHPIGDALLVRVAQRLRECAGQDDIVCRLGGDEFAVIAPNASDHGRLEALAADMLAAAVQPLEIDGRRISAGGSIGIAVSDASVDAEKLFSRADIALYVAKSEARGHCRFFQGEMEGRLQDRQALRIDLAAAIERDELELHYQPVVRFDTGLVSGFEALLRWRHPARGLIPPDEFIGIAEESGLIVPIGEWLLRTACAEAIGWPDSISVAVNFSTKQFAQDDLPGRILAILKETGLSPERLELEITESALLHDTEANLATLRHIHELGVSVVLDDFGTGYSSFRYLQKFRFSKLKIDRSFIEDVPHSEKSNAIAVAIIGLGNALGVRITAEGVETREQYEWVGERCHEAQGFFLSRPVPAVAVPALIAKLNAAWHAEAGSLPKLKA